MRKFWRIDSRVLVLLCLMLWLFLWFGIPFIQGMQAGDFAIENKLLFTESQKDFYLSLTQKHATAKTTHDILGWLYLFLFLIGSLCVLLSWTLGKWAFALAHVADAIGKVSAWKYRSSLRQACASGTLPEWMLPPDWVQLLIIIYWALAIGAIILMFGAKVPGAWPGLAPIAT